MFWTLSVERQRILESIDKQVMEGETVTKVIINTLIKQRLLSDTPNDDGIPVLVYKTIDKYVRNSCKKMGLPRDRVSKIKSMYRAMVKKHGNQLPRGYAKQIASAVGCGNHWVYDLVSIEKANHVRNNHKTQE